MHRITILGRQLNDRASVHCYPLELQIFWLRASQRPSGGQGYSYSVT
jgi:hypothetical protein